MPRTSLKSGITALLILSSLGFSQGQAATAPKSSTSKPKAPATQTAATAKASTDTLRTLVESANKAYGEGNYTLAEASFKQALKLTENAQGTLVMLDRATLYSNLGTAYFAQKRFTEAEQAYKSALDIQEKLLQGHHAMVADTLRHYSALLRRMNRETDADKVETQAEYLAVGALLDKHRDFNFDSVAANLPKRNESEASSVGSTQATSAAPAESQGAKFSIARLIKMSSNDKALLANPTTIQKPVYRTETYYEGGMWDPMASAMIGAEKKTRQVLDHYETANISENKDLSYVATIADLERRFQLSQPVVRQLLDAINSGGSAVELSNGWLLVTDEDLNQTYWYNGLGVLAQPSRTTAQATYNVATTDGRHEFVGKRVAVVNN